MIAISIEPVPLKSRVPDLLVVFAQNLVLELGLSYRCAKVVFGGDRYFGCLAENWRIGRSFYENFVFWLFVFFYPEAPGPPDAVYAKVI